MKPIKRPAAAAGMLAIYALLAPPDAWPYLDPGTGSYIFQLLIAGLMGGAFVVKLFWGRIKAYCLRVFSRRDKGGRSAE